jgi:molecular chaperone DnaK (HSP70)
VKLFQIEEPDGGPTDPNEAGAAIGIDAGGVRAEVAFSVGGNALMFDDRAGFEQALPVPAIVAPTTEWQSLLEGARLRAERALARPVTHAVVVLAVTPDADAAERLRQAAERAGLEVLRLVGRSELPAAATPALAAAILAEELAPRPDLAAAPDPG